MDYQEAQSILKSEDRNAIRAMRVSVFRSTVAIVRNYGYEVDNHRIVFQKEEEQRMVDNTVFYEKPFDVDDIPIQDEPTQIDVVNEDCLVTAKDLLDKGYNVAVLNMASRRNPGGGVYGGAGAQEENLFRRSNLFVSMYQFAPYAEEYGLKKSVHQYPLDRNWGGVYTEKVI